VKQAQQRKMRHRHPHVDAWFHHMLLIRIYRRMSGATETIATIAAIPIAEIRSFIIPVTSQ
jgi:hypothetical protein